MATQARDLRISTARTVKHKLYDASDAGIQPKSRWEKFKDGAAKAWDITIKVATVVVAVLSIVALVAGGPLVWGILFALSAALLADSLMNYANGEGSLWEVGLNMLGVIPGGRLLGAAGKLIGRSATGTRGLAAGGRTLATGRDAVTQMGTAMRAGLGRTVLRLGDETGSASVDLLTLGLTRVGRGGAYARPSGYRAGVRKKVWDDAVEPATGRVRDPQTGQFMSPDKPWDMVHRPGFEARMSRAGFDGDHQATEDQGWQHHGSTRRSFGSERSA